MAFNQPFLLNAVVFDFSTDLRYKNISNKTFMECLLGHKYSNQNDVIPYCKNSTSCPLSLGVEIV